MRIVVDTNRLTDALNGDPSVVAVLQRATDIAVPFVALGEVRYGFAFGTRMASNEQRLGRFLASEQVRTLWPDERTTAEYARLRNYLRRQGNPIPTDDVWIAALAVQHDLSLYTRDQHFDRLPQVRRA